MILNMNGGRSAGNDLNFKVVGGTSAPANPAENTIWVNTNIDIPAWEISSVTNPTWNDMQEGFVYITSEASWSGNSATINMLKKHGAFIKIIKAIQYVAGAWVEKSVRIYQNGAWVDVWDGHLLDGANKYEDVTGGWVNSTTCKLFASQNSNANGKATFDSNGIVFGRDTTIVNTANKIDLSNYSTLKFHVDATTGQTAFGVMSSVSGSVESNSAALKYSNAPGTTAIDVSSLNGSYYVVIGQDGAYTGTISKVWLEA